MVFSSIPFLCIFFPLTVIFYYLLPSGKIKNYFLLSASMLFYAYGEGYFVFLMIACAFINYVLAGLMEYFNKAKKGLLFIAVVIDLGTLGIFKYTEMIILTVNNVINLELTVPQIRLPAGISFFIFQALSYVTDVYRGKVEASKKFSKILLYISFFPQLIAGPIIKYHSVSAQIEKRGADLSKVCQGMRRFIMGLSKKVLLADTLAVAVDSVFSLDSSELGMATAWIGAVAYMFQIYYDFSGYSDMAIGMGKIFGFDFAENFQLPYASSSIQMFWRRWHISLTDWFREYLYIPLGGNRKGKVRTWMNRMIVFFCTGLWHGADWTYVLWGLFHGVFISLETVFPYFTKRFKVLRHIYVLLVVCVGFVIFRSDTMEQAVMILSAMFTNFEWNLQIEAAMMRICANLFLFVLVVSMICAMPVFQWIKQAEKHWIKATGSLYILNGMSYVCSAALLLLCMMSLAGGTYHPFIYFRF